MFKDPRIGLILLIALIDVVAANGLGALATQFVVGLSAKPVLLTGATALMLAIQLALSPGIGNWSDKIGRRPVAIVMTILSLVTSVFLLPVQAWGYFVNRSAKGATNGLYAVLRSAVSDIAPKEDLIKYSGILSFLAGGGALIGPMLTAGLLIAFPAIRVDVRLLVYVLLGLSVLNVVLSLFLKETNDKEKGEFTLKEFGQKALNSIKVTTLWQQLGEANKQVPGIKPIFILNILATLGFGYYAFFIAFLTQGDLDMTPLDTAYFFLYMGSIAVVANFIFFTFIVDKVHKRNAIIALVLAGIVVQIMYVFADKSTTLLYVTAGIDAMTVSLLGGLIGGILTHVTKEGGGQGEMFGNIQALGGIASFVSALVNSLLSGVSMKAPFIFCALSSLVVLWWVLRLPDEARKYTDRIGSGDEEEDQKQGEEAKQPQPAEA